MDLEEFNTFYFMRSFYFPGEKPLEIIDRIFDTYNSASIEKVHPYDEFIGEIATQSKKFPGFKVINQCYENNSKITLKDIVKDLKDKNIASITIEPISIF